MVKMRTGIIYRYENKQHEGYSYIGQTLFNRAVREGLDCKRYDKCIVFKRAIEKYGIENFEYTILEENIPENQLDEREQYWISYYHTFIGDPLCKGYNMTPGGSTNRGRVCRQETKRKISESQNGHTVSDKVKQNMIDFNKSRKGIKPKNHSQALNAAHETNGKKIQDFMSGEIFNSKIECALYYGHSVSWVNSRLKGHKKCREEKFAEITLND